ncbi:MAG TPA: ATP-binding cassette domain-containing protein [Gemmatimonadales bacterium]|jgi:ATP-binding cassette subfamily B protein|nr:ATP-binding cassette domain-containing protein [Gemmatimonadales bacterium]
MNDLALFHRLLQQSRPHWLRLVTLFAIGLLASPLTLLAPLPLKIGVDSVLGSRPLPGWLHAVVPTAMDHTPAALLPLVAILALVIALLTQLQAFATTYLTAAAGERLVLDFRARIFRHLQRMSLSYHDTVGTADSGYRIQTDAPAIRNVVVDGFIPLVGAALTLGSMLYVTVRIDWELALVALAVSPPLLLAAHAYRPRLRRESRTVKKLESAALGVVHEVLGALRVVKAFGQEAGEDARFARRAGEGLRGRLRLAAAEGRFAIIVGLVTAAGMALVLFVGVGHVRAGLLTLGDLLLVMGYIAKLYDPLKTISRKAATLQVYLASLERAFALLNQAPDVTERPNARPLARARGAIAFRDVSFGYGPDRPVLHDVTFEVGPGTRFAIVGTTGAGKSTLMCLLTRLYDPTAGAILLDGVDIRDYRLEDLRRQFAVVHQDPVLFSVSIAENIAYAVPGASREQIVAAAQAAKAHEFIVQLPQGYDTQVGERGVKLSGGQRQRIALARAFLKDSPVLILDEPTSAVDQRTEAAIVEAMEGLERGRTVITISHRANALRRCSAALTIEHGRVVEAGSRVPPPPRPIAGPAPVVPATRQEKLLAHPAVQAWRRVAPDQPLPARVVPVKVKADRDTAARAYRLEPVEGDGPVIIAKGCRQADAVLERIVYEDILPHVRLPGPRCYGVVADPDAERGWVFLEELRGEEYSNLIPSHRTAAAQWLSVLHSGAQEWADPALLPTAGPLGYRDLMQVARDAIHEHLDNPALGTDDLAFLDTVLARFEDLDEHWDRLAAPCAGMPETLVHGDFNRKNLRVQEVEGAPRVVVFDWGDAGWGVPTTDLAQSSIAARPDLHAYWEAVRERWPAYDRETVERLAQCGSVFRALAAMRWASRGMPFDWAPWSVANLRLYDAELTRALDDLGWAHARHEAGVSAS